MRQYIPIDKDDLPDIFEIELAGDIFTMRVDYNQVADYYTLTIQKDGETLLNREPLLLGNLVGGDIPNASLPKVDLRTMDETVQATDQGMLNFGENVRLYLDVVDPNGSETDDPSATPFGYDPNETDDDLTDSEV
ncbi:hypothetical protein [Lactobacillus sp.]|uniref:phage baseplate plug family protein n=1 Tax=Lactobacillus sp. TaxID=1591 RepID=UPI0019BD246B|nr:hypothetical protein [Lactobacillus sp.]MBD5430147.1 hypothetical protein [Lactobacillus sp.]